MSEKHIDELSGIETTGHEWDGIKELNNPLPRWSVWTFYATIVWALAYTIFYPAWPMLSSATTGVLGYSSRNDVKAELAAAVAAIANDGRYMKPYVVQAIVDKHGEIIKEYGPEEVRQVISPETSKRMRQILATVVETGTGKMAQSKLYRFAGKTGTAQKVEANGTYSHSKFVASFIGFAPADDPEIAIAVIVDEPRPYYYGGVVSAPAFKMIAEDVLKYRQMNGTPVD